MTKVVRLFLIVVCLLTFKLPSFAQGPGDPVTITSKLDTFHLCPGNDLWIPIRLKYATNIGAASLVFSFNQAVIQYANSYFIPPEMVPGFLSLNFPSGQVLLAWFAITPFSMADDSLITFKFHYSGGSTPLTWSIGDCSYADASAIPIDPEIFIDGLVNSDTYSAIITSDPQTVTICESSNTSFSVGVQYGISYQWQYSSNGGTTWSNLANDATYSNVTTTTLSLTNTPVSANNYLIRCVVTDICNLQTNSNSATLHVQAKPTVNAGPNDTICAGFPYTLAGLGSNYNSILWSGGLGGTWTNGTTLTPTYTPSAADQAAGSVMLFMTGQGVLPCTIAKDTMILIIHAIPNASAGNDTTICIGGSAVLNGSGGSSYVWSTVPPQTTQSITVTPTSITTYHITVSNYGCTDTAHVTVSVQTGPVVNAGLDGSICADQTFNCSGSVLNVSDFQWSTTGDGSFNDPTILNPIYYPGIVDMANGSVYLVLGGLPNSPCLVGDYDSLLLTLIPLPQANAGSDVTVCRGNPAVLVATGGTTYVWNTIPATSNDTLTVSPNDTATYVVTVSNVQCSATDTIVVNVLQLPVVTLTNDTMICSGDSIILEASGGLSYLWSNGDFISFITVFPTATTTYIVTVTDIHTCHNTGSVTVTVNASLNSSISPLNPTICEGGSITLTASASHPSNFVWAPGEGLSNTTGPVVIANPIKTTEYNVTATDAMGCSSVATVNLVVYQNPPVEVHPPISNLCKGDTLTLTAYGATSYFWSPSTGLSSNSLPTVFASPKHSIIYNLTGTDQHNCSATVTVTINVLPIPVTTLPDSIYICRGENYLLDAYGHIDSCTYFWQDATTESYNYATNPGVYYVTINRLSCAITDTVIVKACSEVFIPNAFSPNNDGINDLFYVVSTDDLTEFHMTIYNRWGERVFHTDSPYIPWDGSYDGKRCPTGVYHYVIEYLGQGNVLLEKEGKKYGQITLFR